MHKETPVETFDRLTRTSLDRALAIQDGRMRQPMTPLPRSASEKRATSDDIVRIFSAIVSQKPSGNKMGDRPWWLGEHIWADNTGFTVDIDWCPLEPPTGDELAVLETMVLNVIGDCGAFASFTEGIFGPNKIAVRVSIHPERHNDSPRSSWWQQSARVHAMTTREKFAEMAGSYVESCVCHNGQRDKDCPVHRGE